MTVRSPEDPPIPIYALDGQTGRQALVNHPASLRYIAYTYGVLEPGSPVPEGDASWIGQAEAELNRVTATPDSMLRYARMIIGLAKQSHQEFIEARTDSLSGLPNRLAFYDQLEYGMRWVIGRLASGGLQADGRLLPPEPQRGLLVGGVDLDRFKDVNDVLGHGIGDLVIAMLGARLRRITRHGDPGRRRGLEPPVGMEPRPADNNPYPDWDFIARIGGDEFGIIVHAHEQIPHSDPLGRRQQSALTANEALLAAAERIEGEIAKELGVINTFLQAECVRQHRAPVPGLRARFGWHNFESGETSAMIMRNADKAMYHAKREGKAADAAEDREKLSRAEKARILGVIALLDRPEFARYRRIAAELRLLLDIPS